MALCALRGGMGAGQREACSGVVELRAHPLDGRVTRRAVLRETGRDMRRRIGLLEIREMAPYALQRRIVEVSIRVALGAGHCLMGAGQLETGQAVIECGILPPGCVVTGLARGWEIPSPMIRIRRFCVIRQVAAGTGGRRANELIAHMALRARNAGVQAGQGEGRELVVVKGSTRPRERGMAE